MWSRENVFVHRAQSLIERVRETEGEKESKREVRCYEAAVRKY